MRNVIFTSKFKKDFKTAQKTPKFKKYAFKFEDYVSRLCAGENLPKEADNHKLSKSSPKAYKDCYEFKAAPDVCVIYRMNNDSIELVRIGQHNDLELTENILD